MIMNTKSWKASFALILTLGMGSAQALPLLFAPSASAQLFRNSPSRTSGVRSNQTFRIVRGTVIPTVYDDGETTKIVVTPDETLELTLTTERAVRSTRGTEIIPAGSQVIGQIEPYEDGVRFVADRLELEDGTSEALDASSRVISRRERVEKRGNDDAIWQGALVGGGRCDGDFGSGH